MADPMQSEIAAEKAKAAELDAQIKQLSKVSLEKKKIAQAANAKAAGKGSLQRQVQTMENRLEKVPMHKSFNKC